MTAAATATAAAADPRIELTLDIQTLGGPARVALALDPTQTSQAFMLEHFRQGVLYEAETAAFLFAVLAPGDGFVDVGTHVGYFSMLAAAAVGAEGAVWAFEPEARNHAQVIEHARRNRFAHVSAAQAAVGATDGEAILWVNADNDGGHGLWDVGTFDWNARSRAMPERRTVPLVTLDAFFAARPQAAARLRVLKIDAEGSELRVLQGARGLLAAGRIPYVVCESNAFALAAMQTNEAELRAFMEGCGFETHLLAPDGSGIFRLGAGDRVEGVEIYNLLFRHRTARSVATG